MAGLGLGSFDPEEIDVTNQSQGDDTSLNNNDSSNDNDNGIPIGDDENNDGSSKLVDENSNDNNSNDDEITLVKVLNSLTGFEVDGDFDDSPEGIANYVKKSYEKGIEQFTNQYWEQVSQNEKLHALNKIYFEAGQEEFEKTLIEIANSRPEDILKKEFDINNEADMKSAKQLYIQALKENPYIDDETIASIVEKAEDEGTLHEKAEKIRKEKLANFSQKEKEIIAEKEQKIAAMKKAHEENSKMIIESVSKGDLSKFKLPEKDKQPFLQYINENAMYDNEGKIFVVKYLDSPEALASEFYNYRKGNLEDIVQTKVKSANALNLVDKYKSQQEKSKSKQGNFRLGQLD